MKKLLLATLFLTILLPSGASVPWQARWISAEHQNGEPNTWMAFRKVVDIASVPENVEACIAADTRYWLWINGEMVVREGGLKRGPAPGDGYFDRIRIAPYLKPGRNIISVLVDHFGKSGFSHMSSGIPALLFEARGEGLEILSDRSWEVARHTAYQLVPDIKCNYRLPESNVRYDAREFGESWINSTEKMGRHAVVFALDPESAPFGRLVERPIPQWKDYGIKNYLSVDQRADTLVCALPYNAHFSPLLRVKAEPGKTVRLFTDHAAVRSSGCVIGEYVTRDGEQSYEHLPWMNGQYMYYVIPEGVTVESVGYRETGYDCDFAGTWTSDDPVLNEYWQKAIRTLYVCMRDTYMDCPDRERAQWWGDEVHELTEAFYALTPSSWSLARKGIRELCSWAAADGALYAPVPCSNYFKELPQQSLASVGWYGFRTFAFYSGDESIIGEFYPAVHKYLHETWQLNSDYLPIEREIGWNWADWGSNIDRRGLLVPWYYLALKAEMEYALQLGLAADAAEDAAMMAAIEESFNRLYWSGSDYRSPGFEGPADDRLQAIAVVSGLCPSDRYPEVLKALDSSHFASTYFLRYVLEAYFRMGQPQKALERMREFYPTAMKADYSTLWEHWNHSGTSNHAWTGSGIVVMMEELAGIKPLEPGFRRFAVAPQMGSLREIDASFQSAAGTISVSLRRRGSRIDATIGVPQGAVAVVRDRRGKEIELPSGLNKVRL